MSDDRTKPAGKFQKLSRQVIPRKPTAKILKSRKPHSDKIASLSPQAASSKTQSFQRNVKITFRIRYHTNFGQSLFLTGNHPLLGNGNFEAALPLRYLNDAFWETEIILPVGTSADEPIIYNYFVRESNGERTYDWGSDKVINLRSIVGDKLLMVDSWNFAGFYENSFYTKPFKNVLLPHNHPRSTTTVPATVTHVFRVKAPLLTAEQTICLIGDNPTLHDWNADEPVLLGKNSDDAFYTASLNLSGVTFPVSYKYGVFDVATHKLVRLEAGDNRTLPDVVTPNKQTIVNDGFAYLPPDTWKGAGVAIPVFSLRSVKSFGVGEFADLKLLVDWGHKTGFKLIQLLPINDTMATQSWTDSYPYAAISAFALHPLYLNLEKLAAKANLALLKKLAPERKRLNALDALDYEAVIKAKFAFIRKIFPSQKDETFARKDYQEFFEHNRTWLVPYAAFCHLRNKFGTADFNQWPQHREFKTSEITALANGRSPARDEIELQYFIQYHLHCQLKDATDYAREHGMVVKGDLPIGIYRYGADAWQKPELYNLDMQAGAPPDAFAAKGQNWGFPTYNWPRMQADNFAWWKHRCEQMSNYFDAFRIDHILGFFRIWSIPMNAVEGILGYFVPAIPVRVDEFKERDIRFDPARYAKPYITDHVLRDIFQNDADEVKRQFLVATTAGNYALKPEFDTQRKVEKYFTARESNDRNEKIKIGVYDLISNVILFEEPGSAGQQFHFRLGMENTSSFKNLDANTQTQLRDLYLNYFFSRQDDFWAKEAMQKLPALKRVTDMLVCGEDLGMVPACVPEVMRQLGLLSLEIQRMPKKRHREFSDLRDSPYLSVVTPGTHDMSTIRGWWEEEDKGLIRRFYQNELDQTGEPPANCEAWINRAIVVQHLESTAMLSIFQLQDLLGMDENLRRKNPSEERINVPGNPKHYWRYRMHLTLQALNDADAFNGELREYIQQSGR